MVRITYTKDDVNGTTYVLETEDSRREGNIGLLGFCVYKETRKTKDAKPFEKYDAPALVERLRVDIIATAITEMTKK